MDILGGLVAMRHQIPYVLSERNTGLRHLNGFRSRARRWIGGRARAIVANSIQGLEYWESLDTEIIKRNIANGLPIEELERFRKKARADCDRNVGSPLVLFAGRFTHTKNIELVLDTFVEVVKRRENVIGRLFGDGPLVNAMQEKVVESGFDNRIQICSYTNDLWQYMATAEVLVSFSSYEGQPNVVLEAAAIGCPLLLSDIPAHRELFCDQEVRFLDDLTVAASVEMVINILDDKLATLERAAMASKAVEDYSIEICARHYRDLYLELLYYNE
jgi:glycosyltransferase involved in cell wall biosynthesis